jgi:hypothetical protein
MAREPTKRIRVPEGSDLAKLLTEAADRPILLERNGELFRLERIAKKPKLPSPEEVTRSREGILKAAGSWKDIDTDKLIANIYRAREEGSRPDTRP